MLVTIGDIMLAIILVYRDSGLSTLTCRFSAKFQNPFETRNGYHTHSAGVQGRSST
jgi:hypothetical protein